jgi:hypothetical protein
MYFSAGGFGPAKYCAPTTAGGLRPSTIHLAVGLNFVTMLVPSSTVQMLSIIDVPNERIRSRNSRADFLRNSPPRSNSNSRVLALR